MRRFSPAHHVLLWGIALSTFYCLLVKAGGDAAKSFWTKNALIMMSSIFQAESDSDKEGWMSVLLNSKDGALTQAFQDPAAGAPSSKANQDFIELQRTLVNFIRRLPGNDKCCDCDSNNGEVFHFLFSRQINVVSYLP
jgi:hypothetical protein